jgi:hypothetical protein
VLHSHQLFLSTLPAAHSAVFCVKHRASIEGLIYLNSVDCGFGDISHYPLRAGIATFANQRRRIDSTKLHHGVATPLTESFVVIFPQD